MKTITSIKNAQKEEFIRDFRLRIFYSFMLDGSLSKLEAITDIMTDLGYMKVDESVYADKDRNIYVLFNDNSLTICFEHDMKHSVDRLKIVSEVFGAISKKINVGITTISTMYINRYLLYNFTENETEKKQALNFFFTRDFATDEELLYKESETIVYSKVAFSVSDIDTLALDFTIIAGVPYNNEGIANFIGLFEMLEKQSYNYWRTAVSKKVLDEMRRKDNE